jgi:cytochrome c oxidase subunit 2
MSGRRPRRWLMALAGALTVLGSGCAKDAPQDTLKPKGPEAQTIHNLITPVFGVAAVVFVLILGGALFVAFKFRAKDDDDFHDFPEQVHGNTRLEIGWTILPAVILLFVGIATVATIFDLAKEPPKDAVRVQVTGQQWWWEYRYDLDGDKQYDDAVTANDLVIPAGRPVSLRITSRDVIHSFWAPRLNGKKDAVPNHRSPLTIEADKPGEYIGQCTEFCGLSHAEMRLKVVAVDDASYEEWTKKQQESPDIPKDAEAIEGWKVFAGQCTSCHHVDGMKDPSDLKDDAEPADAELKTFVYPKVINQQSGAVPNLTHLMTRSTFAGAKFDLRKDTPECDALGWKWAQTDDGVEKCLNRAALEKWLRNPPAMKAMAPGEVMSPRSRGMPNLNLTEQQIDQLVAYLSTLR